MMTANETNLTATEQEIVSRLTAKDGVIVTEGTDRKPVFIMQVRNANGVRVPGGRLNPRTVRSLERKGVIRFDMNAGSQALGGGAYVIAI